MIIKKKQPSLKEGEYLGRGRGQQEGRPERAIDGGEYGQRTLQTCMKIS
jgi:hypothetical protein